MDSPCTSTWYLSLPLLLLFAVGLTGCEEDVVAVRNTGIAYSMYGVLNPQADTQWVRVYPIEATLGETPPAPLGATFTSIDQTDGSQRVWQDSLLQEPDGLYAHVYWSPFRVAYGHDYLLRVSDEAGLESTVLVAVPVEATLTFPDPDPDVPVPSLLAGTVSADVPNMIRIEVTYNYRFKPLNAPGFEAGQVVMSYNGKQRPGEGDWVIPIALLSDTRAIEKAIKDIRAIDSSVGVELLDVTLRLIVANEEWSTPGGTFDPEVLVQPGLLRNVVNGFGFVGGGYRLRAERVFIETGNDRPDGG